MYNFPEKEANPLAKYVSETDFLFLNYDREHDHIFILELDGDEERILSL